MVDIILIFGIKEYWSTLDIISFSKLNRFKARMENYFETSVFGGVFAFLFCIQILLQNTVLRTIKFYAVAEYHNAGNCFNFGIRFDTLYS